MGNFKLDGRTIAIGIVGLLIAIVIGSQLLGRGNDDGIEVPQDGDNSFGLDEGNDPQGSADWGQMVTARNLDADSCPVDVTSDFSRSDTVYVVLEDSAVPQGTDMFVRLFQDGQPVEDSPLITADRDYDNTCIYFQFEATSGAEVLPSGDYEAQLVVNGNPIQTIDFNVQ
jgi:hypothetical protein